jgi:hypothetical protein
VITTNILAIGLYDVCLQVDDSLVDGWPFYFYVNVITAGQTLDSFISDLRGADIPKNRRQLFINTLSIAEMFFNRGQMPQGCAQLEVYKKLVKVSHFDSTMTSNLLRPAQDILDAFNNTETPSRGPSIGPMFR